MNQVLTILVDALLVAMMQPADRRRRNPRPTAQARDAPTRPRRQPGRWDPSAE